MRILITGGTGLVGRALLATADPGDELWLVHLRDYPVQGDAGKTLVTDVRDHAQLSELFDRHRFDVVIHAAGFASVDYVERHFQEGWESNVIGTQNVVDLTKKYDIPLVYLSSNAVFDGTRAPYREDDAMHPVNRYGAIKAECEQTVRRLYPEAAIVRPILMYGWHAPETRTNPVTWIINRLQRKEATHLVTDVYENPLWSAHCGEAIWRILRLGKAGVFHIAGRDTVNRFEFAKLVADVFQLDASFLHPVTSDYFPQIAPRPRNTSFLTQRMQDELGMAPLSLLDGLQRMRSASPPH